MSPSASEWLNLILRWVHVLAGILWIGQTYFFTWLDGRLTEEEKLAATNLGAQVWMVHSGGFYVVERQKVPALLPRRPHWFRWEAAITWLSGMLLLILIYYMGGILVDDSVANISLARGVAIGLGLLVAAWFVYDGMWRSPVGKSEALFSVISFLLVVSVACGLTHTLSARAAYIHVGAMFGTLMAANVWMRILPAQRQMLAALNAGQSPDVEVGARAKLRTKHNTYMVVPLVFIMLSSHFPSATYGSRYNWEILCALILAGWLAARFLRRA